MPRRLAKMMDVRVFLLRNGPNPNPNESLSLRCRFNKQNEQTDARMFLLRNGPRRHLSLNPRFRERRRLRRLTRTKFSQCRVSIRVAYPFLHRCEKPYETTLTSSLLSLVTHSSKEIWKDAEITGEYISFLPSLKETKDKQEIFRRQGVVSGYPKRTLPYWEDAIEAAVRERKKAESLWRRLGRMRKSS